MDISLSILGLDFNNVESFLKPLTNEISTIHLDVMDGHFVPNISFGPSIIASLRRHYSAFFDTHLMISNPEKYLDSFMKAGSDAITFHLEATTDPMSLIQELHQNHVKAGLSIKPATSVEELKPYLKDLDLILVMSVEPGFGGQKFMMSAIDKVKKLYEWKKQFGYSYTISIDGGICEESLPMVQEYIDLAVVGSCVTSATNPIEKIHQLKHI